MWSLAVISLQLLSLVNGNLVAQTSKIESTSDPILSLPYADYRGYHNATSNLYIFKSIRFAADTSGQNRWREAQPPANERDAGIQDATQWPKQCPQATNGGVVSKDHYSPLQEIDDEDCLFLSAWVPDGVSIGAKNKHESRKVGKGKKDLLPVLVWIHGGGWDRESPPYPFARCFRL